MAIETAIVTGLTPTTTGTVSYEVAGFGTPQAAIVLTSRARVGTNPIVAGDFSVGMTDGTRHHVTGIATQDAVGTTNTQRLSAAGLVRLVSSTGSLIEAGTFSAWATNGLTINYTAASSGEYYVTVILIKGCTSAYANNHQLTATGVNNITNPGFKPNLVFMSCIGNAAISDTSHAIHSFGAAHNNSSDVVSQGQVAFSSVDNSATEVATVVTRGDSCVGQLHNEAQSWKGSAQDFDASGFSINTGTDSPGNDYIYYLALDTGDTDGVDISVVDSPTATGTWNQTAPGFQPQIAILGLATGTTTNTLHTADPMATGLGVFDGTTESCTAIDVDDAATTSDVQANYADKAVQMYEFGGTSHDLMFEGTFSAFDSLGYDLSFPTYVDGTARKWLSISVKGVTTGYTLTADSTSYSITGQDSGLSSTRNTIAGSTSYTFTGQDATLTYTPVAKVIADPVNFIVNFSSAELRYSGGTKGGASLTEEEFKALERKQMQEQLRKRKIIAQVRDDEEMLLFL